MQEKQMFAGVYPKLPFHKKRTEIILSSNNVSINKIQKTNQTYKYNYEQKMNPKAPKIATQREK